MFTQTERDFPDDYNPPARLARTYFELKRYDEALDAATRAITKAYGPRKAWRLFLRAQGQHSRLPKKTRWPERKTLDDALSGSRARLACARATRMLRIRFPRPPAKLHQLADRRAKLARHRARAERALEPQRA